MCVSQFVAVLWKEVFFFFFFFWGGEGMNRIIRNSITTCYSNMWNYRRFILRFEEKLHACAFNHHKRVAWKTFRLWNMNNLTDLTILLDLLELSMEECTHSKAVKDNIITPDQNNIYWRYPDKVYNITLWFSLSILAQSRHTDQVSIF